MSEQGSSFDPHRCTLTVPNDLTYLPMVQGFVREYATAAGFPAQDGGRLDLLMEEAVTNVVHGAFAEDERASFDIICERVPAGMQITVHDEGLPYDPSLTPDYDPDAALERQTGAGLGSFLMQRIADRVEFHNLGSRGKETVFVRYLETASVTDAPPADEVSPAGPRPVPAAARVDLEFGPLRPAQAIEVCRCIYDAYRYTYVNEHLYYPDRVVALNQSGDMVSAVATTSDGEVAGHAALVFPEETREIADLAVVATKARFRGQSVARRLGEYLSEEARARGLAGMFIEEVTVHTFTQQFCHRLGFTDCAFLLAYSPATMAFKGIAEEARARRSVIVGFKYLVPPSPTLVYAPRRHRDMIARIYRELGAPASLAGDRDAVSVRSLPDASVVHVSVNTARSVATLRVPVYGRDLERRLRDEMHRLRREDVKVMDMSLNLSLPGTDVAAAALEKAGFVFTGLIPGGPSGDWLTLQYFNGVVVDYDAIQVEADFARELLAYVRAHDPHEG